MTLFGPVAVGFTIDRELYLSFIRALNIVPADMSSKYILACDSMNKYIAYDPIRGSSSRMELFPRDVLEAYDLIRNDIFSSLLKIDAYWFFAEDGLYGYSLSKPGQDTSEYGEGILRKSYIPIEKFSYYFSREVAQWDPHHPEPPFFERVVKFKFSETILDLNYAYYERDELSIFVELDRNHLTVDFTHDLPINVGQNKVYSVELLDSKEFKKLLSD